MNVITGFGLRVKHLMFPGWVTTQGGVVSGHRVSLKEFQGLGGLIILWCRLRKGQALLEKEPCPT